MRTKLIVLGIAAFSAVALAAQTPPAEPSLQGEGSLKVMTYNMYVGTEYLGITNSDYDKFLQAITNLILDARASDPPGRAQAIARQIAATMPHLVSLQEMATWSTGPSPDNLTVEFDYLQLLLDALAAQGVQYTPVFTLTHFDVTLPSTDGYVRNTWRVVVLARAGLKPEHLSFTNVQAPPVDGSSHLEGDPSGLKRRLPKPAHAGHPALYTTFPARLDFSRCALPRQAVALHQRPPGEQEYLEEHRSGP